MYGYATGAGSTWYLALRLCRKGKGLLCMYLPGIFPTVRNRYTDDDRSCFWILFLSSETSKKINA